MALGADLDPDLALGRARLEGIAAGADDPAGFVIRMDVILHRVNLLKDGAL
jgi:hypothetical protein